jgi:AcrR family transcriptional regulator
VVRAAADLVNAEGAEALTINHLAHRLDIRPPSLYNHIGGIDDLWLELARLNARLLADCMAEASLGVSGSAGLYSLARAIRGYIRRNPGLYQASLRSSGAMEEPDPQLRESEARAVRPGLTLVESLGLRGDEAIHALRAFRSAVHGFATLEAAGGFGLPLDLDESFERMIRMIIEGMETSQAED